MRWKGAQLRNDDQRTSKISKVSKEETTCPTAPKALDLAQPRDAQSVMASLVSSGTIRGEPHFAPRSASIASELGAKVTATGWAGSKSPSTSCERTARVLYDDPNLATRQGISGDGPDFAPCPNHDRSSDCGSV